MALTGERCKEQHRGSAYHSNLGERHRALRERVHLHHVVRCIGMERSQWTSGTIPQVVEADADLLPTDIQVQ